jgi:CRISPR-associated protein Cmr1
MKRKLPSVTVPSWKEPNKRTEWTLQLKVITPMFGGGYKVREVDPICVIRPAAIRGHLRFWWRATVGATYSSPKDLFEAEEEIWGSAESPGKVGIRVRLIKPGELAKCAEYKWNNQKQRYPALPKFRDGWPAYALQPFQGKATRTTIVEEPAFARINTEFELSMYAEAKILKSIESAAIAWIAYGGIGARSRRGCGSLGYSAQRNISMTSLTSKVAEEMCALQGSHYVVGNGLDDPIEAWKVAVETYRDFRQKPGFAREPASGIPPTPGRSRWPEPDSIRRISGKASIGHEPSHPVAQGFPRADLGLPIIFHFKDYDEKKKPTEENDPGDTTLEGPRDGMSRMASPVITKAFQVEPGKYCPIVLVLATPHAWQFGDLRLSGGAKAVVSRNNIDLHTADRLNIYPLQVYSGKPIREAILDFTAQQWKSKVEELK